MLFVYVAIDPDRIHGCKVGVTKDPSKRIKAFRTSSPRMSMYKTWEVPDRVHEKQILDLLRDVFELRSEWVYGYPSLVANIIDGYMLDNGLIVS